MPKYTNSKLHRTREYVSFEIVTNENCTGDAPKQFVVGICPDESEMFPNACYFGPNDKQPEDKLPYFYVNRKVLRDDASPEYEKSLTNLELFSKTHDPPFYIRSLMHDKIFVMDALRLFPIALEKQSDEIDEEFLLELHELYEADIYRTMPVKEFWNMLQELDIDQKNIVIVPDVQQLYKYAHSEWELPDIVFAPDGEVVIGARNSVFYVFQLLMCWKRDKCSNCSQDEFEKEALKLMSVFAEFEDMPKPPKLNVVRHTRYAEIQTKVLTHYTGDTWTFSAGKLEDGTLIYSNLDFFSPQGRGLVEDFFYYSWPENAENIIMDTMSIKRMSSLEEFSKAYNSTLYIRCLMDNDGVVFLGDLLKIIKIALKNQDTQITEQDLLLLLGDQNMERHSAGFYPTVDVNLLLKMIDLLNIDPSRIVIVPGILQQKASEYCQPPFETHAPDTKMAMNSDNAVFRTFQEAFCWKGVSCEKMCQEKMEKVVVLYMETYVRTSTFYISTEHIMLNLKDTYEKYLCETCRASKSNSPQNPLADKNPTDKIPYSDLPKLEEEFGVPTVSDPIIQEGIKNGENIFVWKARSTMFLDWLGKALFTLSGPIVDSITETIKLMVPYDVRNNPNQLDCYVDKVLAESRVFANSKVDQQEEQKENIIVNNMDDILKTIAKLEGKPAKIQEKKMTKNMFQKENVEVLAGLTKELKEKTSEFEKVKVQIKQYEAYKYRHTKITEFLGNSAPVELKNDEPKSEKQTPELKYKDTKINRFEEVIAFQQRENRTILSAEYADNIKLCANLQAFCTHDQVSEYFYVNSCLERATTLKYTDFSTLEKQKTANTKLEQSLKAELAEMRRQHQMMEALNAKYEESMVKLIREKYESQTPSTSNSQS
ncbi:unnamed protein product [Caenorhabditis brenneri]